MSDILVNNKTGETRWPASFNSLRVFSGVSLQKTPDRPITAGDYTLHKTIPTVKPEGDVVTEVSPILVNASWVQQWSNRDHTSTELEHIKENAKHSIDQAAEAERMKHMTAGSGQSAVYSEKTKEVERYKADPAPEVSNYPLLAASIGIDGDTLADIVAGVESIKQQWIQVAANIEHKRLSAKRAVINALSATEIEQAKNIVW